MPEPSGRKRDNAPATDHDCTGFTRFDDPAIENACGSIIRFHVVDAVQHEVIASGCVMPDGSVAVTPRHDGDPIAGETEQWHSMAAYRQQVLRRGWYVTYEDAPGEESEP